MGLIRPSSLSVLLATICMTFFTSACAQQRGFFLYEVPDAKYGSRAGLLLAQCERFDPRKSSQSLNCTFTEAKHDDRSVPYTTNEPPEVLLFNSITTTTGGCVCVYNPTTRTWKCTPPGCR